MESLDPVLYAAWAKYMVISRYVNCMPIRSRRIVFALMRENYEYGSQMFIPAVGVTAADFCAFHVLGSGASRATGE
jgi:hypothetical protein